MPAAESLLPRLRPRIRQFLPTLQSGEAGLWKFSASATTPSLLATMMAWNSYHLLRLEDDPAARGIPALVQSAQDAESGHFTESLAREFSFGPRSSHEPLYIQWQYTDYALYVLGSAGTAARHPLRFVEPYLDADFLDQFLKPMADKNPWYCSNLIMFLLNFLAHEEKRTGDARYTQTAHRVLDFLDATQDPATGFWGSDRGWNLLFAMAGGYHYYMYYLYWNRPVNHRKQVVDHTCLLQMPDGLFSPKGGGGGCEDIDAVDILAKLALREGDEKKRVDQTLRRTWDFFADWPSPDGGFPYLTIPRRRYTGDLPGLPFKVVEYLRAGRPEMAWQVANLNPRFKVVLLRKGAPRWNYSGLPWMGAQLDESDVFSTWFRLVTIALCEDYLGITSKEFAPQFRENPGLGWHVPGS